MLTSSTNLAFCYIIVAFVALVVYIDIKFLLILGSVAILINVVKVISMAVSGRLSAEMITETAGGVSEHEPEGDILLRRA